MAKILTTTWTTAAIVAGSLCPSRSGVGSFLAPLEGSGLTTSVPVELSVVDQSVTGTNANETTPEQSPSATRKNSDGHSPTTLGGKSSTQGTGATVLQGGSAVQQAQNSSVSGPDQQLPLLEDYDLKDEDLKKLEIDELDQRLIHKGSTCVVFRAKRKSSQTVDAIKWIPFSARALNELRVLSKFKWSPSRYLCQLHMGYSNSPLGRVCIAMSVYGQNLRDELERRYNNKDFLPARDILELALKMTKAVRACHENGCVHRDIRLTKFVRDGDGLRLVGFTVAAPSTNGIVDTDGGDAPEILRCREDGTPYDYRVDIFSLGKAIGMLASKNHPSSEADYTVDWPQSEVFLYLLYLLEWMTDEDAKKRPSLKAVEARIGELLKDLQKNTATSSDGKTSRT